MATFFDHHFRAVADTLPVEQRDAIISRYCTDLAALIDRTRADRRAGRLHPLHGEDGRHVVLREIEAEAELRRAHGYLDWTLWRASRDQLDRDITEDELDREFFGGIESEE